MKKIPLYLSVSILGLGIASFAEAQTPAPMAPTAPTQAPAMQSAPGQEQHGEQRGERHPEIHRAIHTLEHAKEDLEHAAHDYHGHRVAAIQHIDGALAELHAALESEK